MNVKQTSHSWDPNARGFIEEDEEEKDVVMLTDDCFSVNNELIEDRSRSNNDNSGFNYHDESELSMEQTDLVEIESKNSFG